MNSIQIARDLYQRAGGLLIDLDGTLVDSSAPVNRAWTAFAARHGLDPATVIRRAQGRPSQETVRMFAPKAAHQREEQRLEDDECTDTDGTLALSGAAEVLGSGRRLAIVTSCSARLADVRLRAAGLQPPRIIVSVDDVTCGKPNPECFLLGARRVGLEPSRCVVIEDSPAGIEAGIAAGAKVIAIRSTHHVEALGGADGVAPSLRELVPVAG